MNTVAGFGRALLKSIMRQNAIEVHNRQRCSVAAVPQCAGICQAWTRYHTEDTRIRKEPLRDSSPKTTCSYSQVKLNK